MGERAAIPKRVYIVPQIPLTPVGKIFKPALRWESIRKVYQEELSALQGLADKTEVKVAEDKVHGSLATITITPAAGVSEETIRGKVAEILARYTVRYQLILG
jgi:fatty-acyl-CoA synthase